MSTPQQRCCAIGLCCSTANDKLATLAAIILAGAEHSITEQAATDAAKVVLETFDLVPLGVGVAIADGYKDYCAEL